MKITIQKTKEVTRKILRLFAPYTFFLLVSSMMLYHAKTFSKLTFIHHPQFGLDNKYFDEIYKIANTSENYRSFLIWDLLFVISISIIVITLFHNIKERSDLWPSKNFFKISLYILAIASFIFDVWEDLVYLGHLPNVFDFVEKLKMYFIAAFFGVFIYYFVLNKVIGNWSKIAGFIKSSFLSLTILSIIGFGLTFMPQGASLIVHLFEQTDSILIFNLIISIFLINVLALFISHFPVYLNFAINKSDNFDKKEYTKANWFLDNPTFGLGIITYYFKGEPSTWKKYLRHSLGVLTYAVWFYVIIKAYDLYHLTHFDAFGVTTIYTIGVLGFFALLFYKSNKDLNRFIDEIKVSTEKKDFYDKFKIIKNWSNAFIVIFAVTITYATVYFLALYFFEIKWSYTNLMLTLFFMLLNTLSFIFYRITKGMWIYVWGDAELLDDIKEKDHKKIGSVLRKMKEAKPFKSRSNTFLRWFASLYSNVKYVKLIRILWAISLVILLSSNIMLHFGDVTIINSSVILIAYIINFYAFFTVVLKHLLFYKTFDTDTHTIFGLEKIFIDTQKTFEENNKNFAKKFLPISFIIILALTIISFATKAGDNIHKLIFSKSANVITVDKFRNNLQSHIKSLSKKNMVKVASFGGGLKSNLWNLLVLDKLNSSFSDTSYFMDRCISFSGVSGGAVGLGNYLTLDYFYRNKPELRKQIIEKIGNANILSIDMAGMFIHDPVLNHFSSKKDLVRKDRSYYAMQKYIELISRNKEDIEFLNKSQQSLWAEMYRRHKHIPALIINTASIGLKPGIAFSLDTKSENVFPGYINLSEKGKDLNYYDAISTSNRFPIMSPTAQVEQKGFFLDGGYFENSGLLTSKFFNETLIKKEDTILNNIKILTVNIINSKGSYIRKFIKENKIEIDSIDYTSNIKAIISGITNLDKLPHVLIESGLLSSKTNSNNQLSLVYMPHWITVEDIEKTIGGRVELTEELFEKIKNNNEKIKSALDSAKIDYSNKGIVEPPLARTLSYHAVEYEKAMIKHHEDCSKELKYIINFLKK